MKAKGIKKAAAFMLAVIMALPISAYGGSSSAYFMAPHVTEKMCSADFWVKKTASYDKVNMTEQEIADFNRSVLDTEKTNTIDLEALPEKFDGREMADSLAGFVSPTGLYIDGESAGEEYYEKIRENIKNADVSDNMDLSYGFAVNRTLMKAYPCEEFLSDDPNDPEWDEPASSAVQLNEPLAIYFTTADGKFSLVKNECCSGWVPAEDIAVCSDKTEWLNAASPKNFIVVTGEKIYLEVSADKDISEKMMAMGTKLELVNTFPGSVAFRLPWNNYVVKIPVRNADGDFSQKLAMIPTNRDVSVGYLPYTTENVLSQAFKLLGNRYGWGGMLNSQDCSGFVRDIYKCFGFSLPRNTTWQAAMPAEKTELSDMTVEEKTEVLDALAPGSILQIPGHEMIYLGEENGLYYTINDVSSIVNPEEPEGGIVNPRGVIVNDLSTLRANGTTWLDNLSCAITVMPESSAPSDTPSAEGSVVVFHTNDMHGNLISSDTVIGADKVGALKKQNKNSILVDGGDATQGVALATLSKGEDVIELMNSAGYDVMAAGNHEFDNGIDQLKRLVAMADFPIISANTYLDGKPFFESESSDGKSIIIEKNGIRVGFFALTTANTLTSTNPKGIEGVEFADEIETAKEQTELLDEQGADIIIAITHMGISEDAADCTSYELAEAMAGTELDAVIDGHSHSVVNEKVGDILVAQTGTGSTAVGKMEITLDERGDAEVTETLLTAEDIKDIAPDPEVSAKADEINKKQSEMLSQAVGETKNTLWGGSINQIAEARVGETNFGSLIADSIIYSAKDIIDDRYKSLPVVAVENGGGFRASVPNGEITMGGIINALPFANTVMYKIIDPSVLYELIETSVSSVNSQDGKTGFMNAAYSGSFLQIGGMRFEYDPNGETGSKVKAIYIDGEAEPLDRQDTERNIIIASNDYVIGSGVLADIPVSGEGSGLMEAVSQYIAFLTENGTKPLDIPVTSGRIKTVGEYVPTDYTAKVRIKNEDGLPAEDGTEIEFYIDSVVTGAAISDEGILSFTVPDGPHGIKLYEDQSEVYVNNYSGAGVIESFGTWNGGFPVLTLKADGSSEIDKDVTTEEAYEEVSTKEIETTEETTEKAYTPTRSSGGGSSRRRTDFPANTTEAESSAEATTAEAVLSAKTDRPDADRPFIDLGNRAWAESSVYLLYDNGIIIGTGEAAFSPDNNIIRGDFMLMLTKMFAIDEEITTVFADVPENSYYYNAICRAASAGIAQGDGTNFIPKANITRQDMISLAYRALVKYGYITESSDLSPLDMFSDKDSISDYAKAPFAALVKLGIIQGSDGMADPLDSATRAEAAVMCAKIFKLIKS